MRPRDIQQPKIDAAMSAHERYLLGIPLNEGLREVSEGRGRGVPLSGEPTPPPPTIDNAERELTSSERGALRELRLHEGWPVFQRLMEKMFRKHQKDAMTRSGNDPLQHSVEVVNAWAYVAMYQRARFDAEAAMQLEVREKEG